MATTLPFYLGETMDSFEENRIIVRYKSNLQKLRGLENIQNRRLYKKEIQELEKALEKDVRLIIQGYLGFLGGKATEFTHSPEKIADLKAVGAEWMTKSMKHFDTNRGNTFWQFTKGMIALKMKGALKKPAKYKGIELRKYDEYYPTEEEEWEKRGTAYRLPQRNRFQILKRISEFPHYDPKIDMERLLYRPTITEDERAVGWYFYLCGKKHNDIKYVAEQLGRSGNWVRKQKASLETEMKRLTSLGDHIDMFKHFRRGSDVYWNELLDNFGEDNIRKQNKIHQIELKDRARGRKLFKKFFAGLSPAKQKCYSDLRAVYIHVKFLKERIEKLGEQKGERGK